MADAKHSNESPPSVSQLMEGARRIRQRRDAAKRDLNIKQFEGLARRHLRNLLLIFATCLALGIASASIADWSDAARGWQSEVVGFLFYGIAMFAGLLALISGFSVYAWFAEYRIAKRDATHLTLEELREVRGGVIGPVRWKSR